MSGRNKLADIPGKPLPERQSNLLADLWDEAKGSFARYGRRSGAQRDASLAMLNQAVGPNTDPLTGAGMKALGLAGLVTHPLAFFPTREEWDERLTNAGNDSRVSRSIGGFLSDLPSLIDPQMAAGGAALAAAPFIGKMAGKVDDVADASRLAGKADNAGFTVYHGTGKYEADKIKEGGFKIFGESGIPDQFELPGISTTPNRSTAQFYAGGENYLTEADRMDPFVMELRVAGSKALYPELGRAEKEFEDAGGKISDIPAFLQFLKGKGYKGVTQDGEVRVFDPADIQVIGGQPMRYGDNGLEQ